MRRAEGDGARHLVGDLQRSSAHVHDAHSAAAADRPLVLRAGGHLHRAVLCAAQKDAEVSLKPCEAHVSLRGVLTAVGVVEAAQNEVDADPRVNAFGQTQKCC